MKNSELIRLLIIDGWYSKCQSGSHLIMRHHVKKGLLTMPNHGNRKVGTGLFHKIMKDAGLKTNRKNEKD
jgi:predicted RNA binding protein YcfA (HicA-like mRNA interferase family)